MTRLPPSALALFLAAAPVALAAQDGTGPCTQPTSVAVRGNDRVSEASILADAGIVTGTPQNYRVVQRVIRALYATGQFETVSISCSADEAGTEASWVITVKERPVL